LSIYIIYKLHLNSLSPFIRKTADDNTFTAALLG
jgi:hypothetical protein